MRRALIGVGRKVLSFHEEWSQRHETWRAGVGRGGLRARSPGGGECREVAVSDSSFRRAARWGALAGCLLTALTSCSLVVDAGREQCSDDADCARLGPGFEGRACVSSLCRARPDAAWSCLDAEDEVRAPLTPRQIHVTARLIDVVFQSPADSSTRVFYEADGLFPPSQQETTRTGVVRVINVPTGNVSVRGSLSDGREIGTASMLTRAGFATLTSLSPVPR